MLDPSLVGLLVWLCLLLAHIVTTALAWTRCRARKAPGGLASSYSAGVSILRPVHGLEETDKAALESTFRLDHTRYEVIFCAESEGDPAIAFCRDLMQRHPAVPARMLVGKTLHTSNPKLNNVEKGWRDARYQWVVMADCNVLMPPDYIQRLLQSWRSDTGVVCSPPIGAAPQGIWAELECAFLNTYQARWQYAADTLGYGFAQGKSMLWSRSLLEDAGGLNRLTSELAEDAAATKVIRSLGLRVRLADRPFTQPLGRRTWSQAWSRQLRWAQLRRSSFPLLFLGECFTTWVAAVLAAGTAARAVSVDSSTLVAGTLFIWLACEALLARACAWHLSIRSPLLWLARDLVILLVWLSAWFRRTYDWRGTKVTVPQSADDRSGLPIMSR